MEDLGYCHPPNMCKGLILGRIHASVYAEKKRIIYLGDGAGDYSPTLKLEESDFVMPRMDYPRWKLMAENPCLIKAGVQEWTNGQNQEVALLGIIRRFISGEEEEKRRCSTRSAVDCKMQMIAVAHELFPPALRIPR